MTLPASDHCRRALVTGASGFIGSLMVKYLSKQGVHVRALVRRRSPGMDAPQGCEWAVGDVTDAASLNAALRGCDVVFHCAWGGTSLEEARRINVEGTRNVVAAAAAEGVRRVVHLSSMAVHGRALPRSLSEEQPLCFRGSAYGVSKAEGEQAAFAAGAALGVEVVALRPTLVYGPRSPLWVLSYFNRVKREQVFLLKGGKGLANLVFVDDLIAAMWQAAVTPGVAGHAFLISGEAPVAWGDYIGGFARMCGKPLPATMSLTRARLELQWARVYSALARRPRRVQSVDLTEMTQHAAVSIAKAQRLLNYQPRVSISEGLERCAAWLRQEGHLARAASGNL
jgi:nucleoside-diphosphate-sugar epimerase